MSYKKVSDGIYKAENGMTIKRHNAVNQFTGRAMSGETRWYIYDANGTKIDWTITLKEAKQVVEGKSIGYEISR